MNQPESEMISAIHQRETAHHDEWAASESTDSILVREPFESLTAFEEKYILKCLGALNGREVLDLGCGLGEASVYYALKGGRVTALDLSPGMVDKALDLAKHHGVSDNVTGVVASAENLGSWKEKFDIVHAANVFHHVTDLDGTLRDIVRVLKPGGMLVAWDPLDYNPAINVYRRMASGVRSDDEHPLRFSQLKVFRNHFSSVHHREFWLSTLVLFLKYYFIDRKNPNETRYWKLIYTETSRSIGWWFKPLSFLDSLLLRIPFVKMLAWNTVILAKK